MHTLTALEYFREHKDSLTTDKYHKCQVKVCDNRCQDVDVCLSALLCQDPLGQLLPERPPEGEAQDEADHLQEQVHLQLQ